MVSQWADLDPLTELPNRALLHDRLTRAISHAKRREKRLAVLFLDLNNFKHINDSLGHRVGDQVLKLAAERLTMSIREADTVGRLGGDEFVILLTDVSKASDAVMIADKITAVLGEPSRIGGVVLHLSASIGISLYPDDGTDSDVLVDRADAAMYSAKRQGVGSFVFHGQNLASQRRAGAAAATPSHEDGGSRQPLPTGERESLESEPNEVASPEALDSQALPAASPAPADDAERSAANLSDASSTLDESTVADGASGIVDLIQILQKAATVSGVAMKSRRQVFTMNATCKPVGFVGDSVRLAQAFGSLLDHASLHTADGGKIGLSVQTVAGAVEVAITDNGIGIRAEALGGIFESRVPVSPDGRSSSADVEALRHGLMLARDGIEAVGGHLVANSPGLGLGSCFVATLPLREVSGSPE